MERNNDKTDAELDTEGRVDTAACECATCGGVAVKLWLVPVYEWGSNADTQRMAQKMGCPKCDSTWLVRTPPNESSSATAGKETHE